MATAGALFVAVCNVMAKSVTSTPPNNKPMGGTMTSPTQWDNHSFA